VTSKVPIALTVTGVALLTVILNWVSLAVALLVASLLFIVTRTLTIEQAYNSINAKILVLLAGMLPLATALQQTGAADLLANLINRSSAWIGSFGALFLLYFCGVLMTQVAPNAVTAAVLTPVATQLAAAQELSPQTFAIAVIFAAGASWLTPLVSSSNLLVQSKGNYQLSDFLRNTIPILVLQAAALFTLFMVQGWGR
jgi:di/tricarboxylate transporter